MKRKTRFEVFKRDKFTCQYCGQSAPDVTLHVDHIHPKSKGGSDDITNLVTSCSDCNLGKSDRLLSNDATVKQRKRQLDELQERREQLEMMMEWQRGLIDLDQQVIKHLASLWDEIVPGYRLSAAGIESLKKYVKRFGIVEVLEAMRCSVAQYLRYENEDNEKVCPARDSVEKAFAYVPRICASKRKMKDKPYLRQLYYIRGILKNRLSYYNHWQSLAIMEEAYLSDVSIDKMQDAAKAASGWTAFKEAIEQLLELENQDNG